MNSFF